MHWLLDVALHTTDHHKFEAKCHRLAFWSSEAFEAVALLNCSCLPFAAFPMRLQHLPCVQSLSLSTRVRSRQDDEDKENHPQDPSECQDCFVWLSSLLGREKPRGCPDAHQDMLEICAAHSAGGRPAEWCPIPHSPRHLLEQLEPMEERTLEPSESQGPPMTVKRCNLAGVVSYGGWVVPVAFAHLHLEKVSVIDQSVKNHVASYMFEPQKLYNIVTSLC